MTSDTSAYLTASTTEGLLIIHSSPVTLSWVPRDSVNDAYNVGGTVTIGPFDSVDDAKRAAREQHAVPLQDWRATDLLPLDAAGIRTEVHTPEVDGHRVMRHGIHWKNS
jgi:hypothetical protein